MKNLSTLSNEELEAFFNSFDQILSDVDGVLWNLFDPIPGAPDAINFLQKIGKKIVLVSNNTSKTFDFFHNELKAAGFDVAKDNIVTPALTMISYLKKQDMTDKKIFVLGMTPLKDQLRDAGFEVVENLFVAVEENFRDFATKSLEDDGSVGCVITDMDVNLTYLNLQKAAIFLEKPGMIFLSGATDISYTLGNNRNLIGAGRFHKILEEMTGRVALRMAKPSLLLKDFIHEKFQIGDDSRVLFIGDSIPQDMGFGTTCGYKKLLVLSGLSSEEHLQNWTFPEEFKPDFYVDNLGVLHDLIVRLWGTKQ